MFLWELKNSIISQNLRELCVIETPKPSRKIPPTVASTSSATKSSITRCLSLSKAHSHFSSGCLSLPNILTSHLGAWACRRHIISILLKSLLSIEHLRCSFENSKTVSFHKISVNFVILKQIQKIHTQWLRQAQPPNLLLHGAWACRRHILTSHLGAWACRKSIISIELKSVCFLEHLRCSFANSKTTSFHKIFVDFVL